MVHDERRMHYPTECYFKSAEEMAALFSKIPGALSAGEAKANEIFDLLEKFAGYGFSKSHSAATA